MRYWHRPRPHGAVAQLGERRPCKAEVVGSNPISSTFVLDARSSAALVADERGSSPLRWILLVTSKFFENSRQGMKVQRERFGSDDVYLVKL